MHIQIGGGSSAMQTLPALREQGKHVDQYVKSTTWVTPMFGAEERDRFFGFKDGLMAGYASQDINRVNPPYSKATQEELHNNPAKLRAHRKGLLNEINGLFHKDLSRKGSQIGQEFKALVTQLTNDRLGMSLCDPQQSR
jgi:cation diffusion facilitator CzcD-associated flavoprotein CzcO